MRLLTALVAALVLALSPGCSTTPTAPTPGVPRGLRSGTWVGTVTDSSNGQGSVRVVLRETPFGSSGVLGGTWNTTFADASKDADGNVVGSVTGTVMILNLQRTSPPSCPTPLPPGIVGSYFALNLALADATISGAYDYQTCGAPVRGTLTLTKQ